MPGEICVFRLPIAPGAAQAAEACRSKYCDKSRLIAKAMSGT